MLGLAYASNLFGNTNKYSYPPIFMRLKTLAYIDKSVPMSLIELMAGSKPGISGDGLRERPG